MIHFFFIAAAALGLLIVVLSRRTITPQALCPNCGTLLDDFSVERCPHCLLWQPPDRPHRRHRWRTGRLYIGLSLIIGPTLAWQAGSVLIQVSRRSSVAGPKTAVTPLLPVSPPGTALQQRIQSLGYLSKRNSPARADSQPAAYPSMTDEEATFYQQMGYQVTTTAPGSVPIDDSTTEPQEEGPESAGE
jgi:hypothetical protein